MTHPPRVAPVDHAALSPRQRHVSVKMGRFGTAEAPNLMRTMLNYPEFARSIGRMSTRVTLTTDLPARLWQLACMRTAWLCGSEYLWAAHRVECLALGITDDDLYQVAVGPQQGALTGLDRLVVEAIDEMHWTHYLSDEKWSGFDDFGHNAPMDLMCTYGFYVTLGAFANTTGVQLDSGLTGWSEALLSLREEPVAPWPTPAPSPYPKRVEEADYSRLTPQQLEQTGRMGRRGLPTTSKLQKAMINYVEFMKAISPFGSRAIDKTCLPPRVWQIACMRTVWRCDSEYLWSQHRKACLLLGVTDEDLLGVAEGPGSEHLNGFDRVVVTAVDQLYDDNRLSDDLWTRFDEFGPEGLTDLILVYGLYVIQACLARNFGTTLEPNTTGYLPELEPLKVNQQR